MISVRALGNTVICPCTSPEICRLQVIPVINCVCVHSSSLSKTLSFALLDLLFCDASFSEASIDLRDTDFPKDLRLHTHTGNSLGHIHGSSNSRKLSLTRRSSSE